MNAYATSPYPDAPIPSEAFDRIANRLRTSIEMIDNTNGNLHAVGDRIFGGESSAGLGGPQAVPAPPPGMVGAIDALLDDLQARIARNSDQAARFHRL